MSARKTVVITGASSGLGAASALLFARRGAAVVLTARREERLQELVAEIKRDGGTASAYAGDAAAEGTADAVMDLALTHYGSIDVLVNNAGQGKYAPLLETTAADFDELMNANMRSSFLMTKRALPTMLRQKSGVILLVSSVAGLAGAANEAVYAATKFAQVGFAQALDAELRKDGIKVQVICPGGMKTEFAIGRGRDQERVRESRMMAAEEAAEMLVFASYLPANLRIPSMVIRHMG